METSKRFSNFLKIYIDKSLATLLMDQALYLLMLTIHMNLVTLEEIYILMKMKKTKKRMNTTRTKKKMTPLMKITLTITQLMRLMITMILAKEEKDLHPQLNLLKQLHQLQRQLLLLQIMKHLHMMKLMKKMI